MPFLLYESCWGKNALPILKLKMPAFLAPPAVRKAAWVHNPDSVNCMSPTENLYLQQMMHKGRDTEEFFLEAKKIAAASGF